MDEVRIFRPFPRTRQIDPLRWASIGVLVLDNQPAAHRLRKMAYQVLDQTRHHLEIGERPIGLQHGELRIVAPRDALVAKIAVHLEDPGESADKQPFQVEFRGDTKIKVHPQRIVVRLERLRRRAAGNRLHHRSLDLNEVPLLEKSPDLTDDRYALAKHVARFVIGNQIEVALTVLCFGILHTMPFLGQRPERFGKNIKPLYANRALARLRQKILPFHADPIPDVQLLKNGKALFAYLSGMDENLYSAGKIGNIEKPALAHVAMSGDASGGTDQLAFLKGRRNALNRALDFELPSKWEHPVGPQGLQLLPANSEQIRDMFHRHDVYRSFAALGNPRLSDRARQIFPVVKPSSANTFSAMFRRFARVACVLSFLALPAEAARVVDSLVRIQATSQEPDYRAPWSAGEVASGVGAGFVIQGNRIMTNAHVVSNERFLSVSKEGDPKPYPARVVHVAHDCDLALLTVDNPNFFKHTAALDFGGIPAIESTVSVYGYPIGGDRLSVTRGVVSRIDFQTYSHSGVDSHLTVQIDAAINPGNSGGPVLQEGKVVGVAFQGYSGDVAQNVGYMIPTPVIRRFLKDVEDGHYDRYMDLTISYHPLHNPAMRKALGLTDGDLGVFVGSVYGGGVSEGRLQPGDVLLAIDGLPIASDGTVSMDGDPVEMAEVVERKFKGEKVSFKVLREGKELTVSIPLTHAWPFSLQARAYNEKPRFVVFGGLVFQPVDANFISEHNPDDLRLRFYFDNFISRNIYRERQEIVVLSNVLADPVNAYASDFRYDIVDKINGQKIQRIDDVAEAFKKPADYYVIDMLGKGRPLVLERKAVEEARDRIRTRYRVTSDENLQR